MPAAGRLFCRDDALANNMNLIRSPAAFCPLLLFCRVLGRVERFAAYPPRILMKRLRVAWANAPEGPWTRVSEPFTEAWVEGPTVLKIGRWWWIYFDHYTKPQHYGAVRTRDWKHFEDRTVAVHFPAGQRHGTAVRE